MKRTAALLSALLILTLTGCTDPGSSSEASRSETTEQTTEATTSATKRTTAETSATETIPPAAVTPGEPISLKNGAWYCVREQNNQLEYYWVITDGQLLRFRTSDGETETKPYEAIDSSFRFGDEESVLEMINSQQLRVISGAESWICTWFEDTSASAFHPASEAELIELAIGYYGARTNHEPEFVKIEGFDGPKNVSLHLYDAVDHHTATCDWYTVNRFSYSGTDLLGGSVDLHAPAPQLWRPDVAEQQTLKRAGNFCGVVYLGRVPLAKNYYEPDDEFYSGLLADTGLAEKYPYLTEIPAEFFASTLRGTELWLVIPADPDAKVRVSHHDIINDADLGDVYRSVNGSPFLLKCNYSDIDSDVRITVTDSGGEHPAFAPYLSTEDGAPRSGDSRVSVLEGVPAEIPDSPDSQTEKSDSGESQTDESSADETTAE